MQWYTNFTQSLLGDPKRYLVHAGDVLELDTDVERPDGDTAAVVRPRELQLVRLILLSDCLLTTVIECVRFNLYRAKFVIF